MGDIRSVMLMACDEDCERGHRARGEDEHGIPELSGSGALVKAPSGTPRTRSDRDLHSFHMC